MKTDAELEDLVSVGEEDVVETRVGHADFFRKGLFVAIYAH